MIRDILFNLHISKKYIQKYSFLISTEERIRERSEELERIKKEHAQRTGSAKKKGKKKAVKHLMSQIFHKPHNSHNSQNH